MLCRAVKGQVDCVGQCRVEKAIYGSVGLRMTPLSPPLSYSASVCVGLAKWMRWMLIVGSKQTEFVFSGLVGERTAVVHKTSPQR